MFPAFLAVIDPATVEARHYFLEELQQPFILWGIRAALIVGALTALLIYWKMRRGKREGK